MDIPRLRGDQRERLCSRTDRRAEARVSRSLSIEAIPPVRAPASEALRQCRAERTNQASCARFYRAAGRHAEERLSRVNPPRLSSQLGPIAVLRRAPIDPLKQIAQLRRRDRHGIANRRRPDEAPAIQSLREQAQTLAVMPQQLYQAAALAAEDKNVSTMGVLLQDLLN